MSIRRRDFVKGTLSAAVVAGTMGVNECLPITKNGIRVAVLGGGCGGMSAAHELAERGFDVAVYEKRAVPGGKCRSIDVPGTAVGGRLPLPGEHGFRFFPGYYKHVTDTMERIPYGSNRKGVYDNLVRGSRVMFAFTDNQDILFPYERSLQIITDIPGILAALEGILSVIPDLTFLEISNFALRLAEFWTSCDARRETEYDLTNWYDFTRADRYSEFYQNFLAKGLTRNLVAAQAQLASTRTIGTQAEQILLNNILLSNGENASRLLNAPTNEAWLDPWKEYLESLDVEWHSNATVQEIHMANGRISGATVEINGSPELVKADFYVLAVPVEVARELINPEMRAAAPELNGLDEMFVDWMTGIQFFVDRELPITNGHITYSDSPWALTSISQGQFWDRDLSSYGDGRVRDIISVDVSSWDTPGVLYGKTAKECTKEEIFREVWEQMRMHLENKVDLDPSMIVAQFLDTGIIFGPNGTPIHNEDPLLINTVGSLALRPDAVTSIPNLFLASDYVNTHTDLATMEGANEAARRAVNGILAASPGVDAEPCEIWPLHHAAFLEPFRSADERRFEDGKPHLLSGI